MPRKIQVELFGKRGRRTADVEPKGFTTRHVRTRTEHQPTEPLSITPNPPKPEPVLPAFSRVWTANRTRLLVYLSDGFHNNLSDGVLLHELGTAIETQYAPPQNHDTRPVACIHRRLTGRRL